MLILEAARLEVGWVNVVEEGILKNMATSEELVSDGLTLEERGDRGGAELAYRGAIVISPEWSVPYFNLGLIFKQQGRWEDALDVNKKVVQLAPGDTGAWWNLGIAATALGNWVQARRAWSACGLNPPPGDGPPDFNFGTTAVRLDPDGVGEVVWAHRIDPARSRIISVPLPGTDYNHGDVLLTDGAPDGHRVVNGRELPVFNVLTRLSRSPFRKFVVELASASPERVDALVHHAEVMGGAAEHWGQSTRILCADCSRGVPHEHEPADSAPAHPHCGLAARDATHADTIITAWLDSVPGLDVIRWSEAIAG